MLLSGWIKLHRQLKSKPIWQCSTPEQKTILITLLMMANHEENEWEWQGERYQVQPGQFITSLKSIAENAGIGISIQNIRTALAKFEKYDFLTNKSTNKNRLITITNWEVYQSTDSKPTSKLTSDQQATNKQLTTNKNDKNDKNDKEENIPLQISNLRIRYSSIQLKVIDNYLDILRWTRKNGKIADSVILKIYTEWEKFKQDTVIYGLSIYINNPKYHDKKENYCYGIMRNAKSEDVNSLDNKPRISIEDENPFLNRG